MKIKASKETMETREIQPKILYYGTPVILLNTLNKDNTTNISPISSSWALGPFVVLGISSTGKAFDNIMRSKQCVLNIPSPELWENVERLAPYTGKNPVPESRRKIGFEFEKNKFKASGLTPVDSETIEPKRIMECPIQIEAEVKSIRTLEYESQIAIVETKALKTHVHPAIIDSNGHIDPLQWSPLIYNFRHYYGLGSHLGKTFRA